MADPITKILDNKVAVVVLAGGAVVLVAWILQSVKDGAKTAASETVGLLSGDNFITRNQTNADGDKTTAYENAGVLGTVGAAANSVSGGWFATAGESLGRWVFDLWGPKLPADIKPADAPKQSGGASGSW